MHKPATCSGCPYEQNRDFLFPPSGEPSPFLLVSDHPSHTQVDEGSPTAGTSIPYLQAKLLPRAGIDPKDLSYEYVIKCYVNPTDVRKRGGKKAYHDAATQCLQHHFQPSPHTHTVICHGDLAAKMVAGRDGTEKFRGYPGEVSNGRQTFVVKPTSELFTRPRITLPMNIDWHKLGLYIKGEFPKPIPWARRIEPKNVNELCALNNDIQYTVIDTEYDTKKDTIYPGKLELIGLLIKYKDGAIQGYQFPWLAFKGKERDTVIQWLSSVFSHYPVVMHNMCADIPVIEKAMGVTYDDYHHIDDTMLMHAIAYSELQHDLGFLEQMYSTYDKMKHRSGLIYNWGDCLSTDAAYVQLCGWMVKHPKAHDVYVNKSLPLTPPLLAAKQEGVKLDHEFLKQTEKNLALRRSQAVEVAQSHTPGINIGSSKQLIEALQKDGVKLYKKRKTKSYSVDEDSVAKMRRAYHTFDPENERDGITHEQIIQYIQDGAHPLLEARAMYQQANQLVTHFINPLKDSKGDYLDRVYPNQFIHTQTSGRWSTTDPPLPTLPPSLRKIITPDTGWVFIKFDWSQIELRIGAALAGDQKTLEGIEKGWDLHTLNMCDMYGYPYPQDKCNPHTSEIDQAWRESIKWRGGQDKRRVAAKGFVYKLNYRGQAIAPEQKAYLKARPELVKYWKHVDEQIMTTRTVESIYGRPRYLFGDATRKGKSVPQICREGTNHPMQATVSDIFNETVVDVWEKFSGAGALRWVYGAHDSQTWACLEDAAERLKPQIEAIAAKPRQIGQLMVNFPIEWE